MTNTALRKLIPGLEEDYSDQHELDNALDGYRQRIEVETPDPVVLEFKNSPVDVQVNQHNERLGA